MASSTRGRGRGGSNPPQSSSEGPGTANSEGSPTRGLPTTRKQEKLFRPSQRDEIEDCSDCPTLFLNSEATLASDVVKYFGLKAIVNICEESQVKVIENRVDGKIVISGSFEAVEDLRLKLSQMMSQTRSSKAFKLAFRAGFSSFLEPANGDQHRPETEGLPNLAATKTDGTDEGNTEISRRQQLCKFEFEAKQSVWRYVVEACADRVSRIETQNEVKITSGKADTDVADTKVTVIVKGQNMENVAKASPTLVKIVEETEPKIAEDFIFEECSDGEWLERIKTRGLKVFHTLKEEGTCCVITGLKKDVKIFKQWVKSSQEKKRQKKSATSGVKYVRFSVQEGRKQIVIKQGDIRKEKVNAVVIPVPSSQQNKGEYKEGAAYISDDGDSVSCVKVQLIMPSESSTDTWNSSDKQQFMWNACYNSLVKAEERKCSVIAIPFIGSQLCHGEPKRDYAESLISATENFLKDSSCTSINEVKFVDIDTDTYDIFSKIATERLSANAGKGHSPHQDEVTTLHSH